MFALQALLGALGGLHRAAYGAYKDSPYEGFFVGRFLRDIVIGILAALVCHQAGWCAGESLLVLILVYFGIVYLVVEIWKLFLRYKDESEYRIPVRIHIGGRAVESRSLRWLLALGVVGVISGAYGLATALPESWDFKYRAMLMGTTLTLFEASGGAYKDGFVEGFKLKTYVRSPLLGTVGGFLLGHLTQNLAFVLVSLLAFERIMIEVKKFFQKGYVPGKFQRGDVPFEEWMGRRRVFLAPYLATWVVFAVLLIREVT